MKKLLAVLLAGFALVACSHNETSAPAEASATEASAPAAVVEDHSAHAVEASAPVVEAVPAADASEPK